MTPELNLPRGINHELLDATRIKKGYSMEALAKKAGVPDQSTKNIVLGTTPNPGIENLHRICEALDLKVEDILYTNEKKAIETKAIKEEQISVLALKEIYETQQELSKQSYEAHIENIRKHYEQHHEDLRANYESRLADKREIIASKDLHIESMKKEIKHTKLLAWACVVVLVGILIAEVMNPDLGWIKF